MEVEGRKTVWSGWLLILSLEEVSRKLTAGSAPHEPLWRRWRRTSVT